MAEILLLVKKGRIRTVPAGAEARHSVGASHTFATPRGLEGVPFRVTSVSCMQARDTMPVGAGATTSSRSHRGEPITLARHRCIIYARVVALLVMPEKCYKSWSNRRAALLVMP
jgi:hypothetical protein